MQLGIRRAGTMMDAKDEEAAAKVSNLPVVLKFMVEAGRPVSSQEVGKLLGVEHPEQAKNRGFKRLQSLLADGFAEPIGARVSRETTYQLTEKGRNLAARHGISQ